MSSDLLHLSRAFRTYRASLTSLSSTVHGKYAQAAQGNMPLLPPFQVAPSRSKPLILPGQVSQRVDDAAGNQIYRQTPPP